MSCRKGKNIIIVSGLDEYDKGLKKTYEKKMKCYLSVGVISVIVALITLFSYFNLQNEWKREIEANVKISNVVVEDKKSTIIKDYTIYRLFCRCEDGRRLDVSTRHDVEVGDNIFVYEYQGICATSIYSILDEITSSQATLVLVVVTSIFCIVLVCISKYNSYKKSLQELMQKLEIRTIMV